jgi:hypothetical protein
VMKVNPRYASQNEPVSEPQDRPTIVELLRSNWYLTLLVYCILFLMIYADSRDGYVNSHGKVPTDEFLTMFIPVIILVQIPYVALVFFYPRYIERVKCELKERNSKGDTDEKEH